jgi:hypothetical protein
VTFVYDIHKFEFSACLDSDLLICSLFGNRSLHKYEKSLKPGVFVCGNEATPGFWVGPPSCGETVSHKLGYQYFNQVYIAFA